MLMKPLHLHVNQKSDYDMMNIHHFNKKDLQSLITIFNLINILLPYLSIYDYIYISKLVAKKKTPISFESHTVALSMVINNTDFTYLKFWQNQSHKVLLVLVW